MNQTYPIYDTTDTSMRDPITGLYFVKVIHKCGGFHYMHPNLYRDLMEQQDRRNRRRAMRSTQYGSNPHP